MFPSPDGQQAAATTGAPVAEGGTSKALLALGGIGAALVVGAGAFFLLNSGGSSPEAIPVPVQPQASAPAAAPSASPSATAKPVARPAAASVTGRDPFKPLFASSVGGSGVTVTAGGGGGGGGGNGGGGGATAAPVPAPAPAAPTVTLSVSKIDEATQSATVAVDGKKYPTTVNAPFGKYYTVYAIFNDSCVGVLYGDQSVAVCTSKPMTVTP
jgi:hypothetical protein